MKKKILFLESRYDSFFGAQKSMLKLIQNLNNDKFVYKVVTTNEGKLKSGFEENNVEVDILKLGKKANVFGGKILEYNIFEKIIVILQIILYNLKIFNYLRKERIDIVYVNDLRAFLYAIIATKLLRKKSVWYIRADVTNSFLTKFGLYFTDHIITIANGVLRNLPWKTIQRFKHKIINIYTGFEFEQFAIFDKKECKQNYNISETSFVIGYLGSINERKGIDLLVESYINLSKKFNDVHLLIVGDVSPGYENFWSKQLKKLEQSSVKFTHHPFTENVSQAFCAMDIFILPSHSEGLPRVVIEAIAHKIPVIATDVGGTKEIIPCENYGALISKNDKEEIIKKIIDFKENEEYRRNVIKNSYKYCKEKFSHDKFVEMINDFFTKL